MRLPCPPGPPLFLCFCLFLTPPPPPGQLFGLSRLHTLYLSSNELERLSPAVSRLSALTALSLHTNRLSSLPPSLASLPSLRVLYLGGNPLPPSLARNAFGAGRDLALAAAAFFARHGPCRAAVRCVMMTALRRERGPSLRGLPKDLRKMVAEKVWATRDDDEWAALVEGQPRQ